MAMVAAAVVSVRRLLLVPVVALVVAGCGSSSTPKVTMSGDLTLPNFADAVAAADPYGTPNLSVPQGSTTCAGDNGYSDLTSAAAVTVEDASGKIVGTASLGDGTLTGTTAETYVCVWRFSALVPSSAFYKVEVSHRGTVTYTLAQVKAGQVHLSLGT